MVNKLPDCHPSMFERPLWLRILLMPLLAIAVLYDIIEVK